jgi:hypothetical protein
VATFNGVPSPQRCIQQELESLRNEMASVPWVLAQLQTMRTMSLPSLSELGMLTFESGGQFMSECPSPLTHADSALNWQQIKWFEEEIQNLNLDALEHVWHSNFYHYGMVRQLAAGLKSQIIAPFEVKSGLSLTTHTRRGLHLWQCVHLQMLLQTYYEEWLGPNDVLLQLERKKDVFPNIFSEVKPPTTKQ